MSQYIKKIRTSKGDKQIDYSALANLPSLNNNLLINSDFRNPVNQRGRTTYNTTSWAYTIDRWRGKNVDVVVNDGSITITATGFDGGNFQQPMEKTLPVNDYIVSINVLSVSGSVYLYHRTGGTVLVPGINTRFFDNFDSMSQVQLFFSAGASIEVEWIKLEQGDVATTFMPRPVAEEFAMCQRYYRYLQQIPIYGIASDSQTYFVPVSFGVPMRTSPIATLYMTFNSSAAEQAGVTLSNCSASMYNIANIKLSKSIGQYGYVTMLLDAEIH